MKRKSSTLRMLVPIAVMAVVAVGFILHVGLGTLSDFGWQDISLICPLGALTTMLASKMLLPRAVVSIVIAAVLILLFGRAFCGWICPVPVVGKLRTLFSKPKPAPKPDFALDNPPAEKPENVRESADSRHIALGAAIVTTLVFGFPVFCLICPIGLTFATILLLVRAFGFGDVSIALVIVPLVLLVEVVFFRKWCARFCPLGALMSLVAKGNRTVQPTIDNRVCIESTTGKSCSMCSKVCDEKIDLRHPERGSAPLNECTRCRACVDNCPAKAISIKLFPKKGQADTEGVPHEPVANSPK